ncbi:MAG TPA: rhodanese-like domain-containing protein [Bacteroidales bacterium]|nr:rhodanese-like domain-containing protein [Bacteroidales bacterium]
MKFITPADLKRKIDNKEPMQIIDTREAEKYELAHIPGALSMPQLELPSMLDKVEAENTVVIYCIYGVKSELVYIYLKDKLKIKDLYILEGGIYAYANEFDPSMQV